MLINFQFRNFGSFRDVANFSMVKSKVQRHLSHCVELPKGHTVLKSAFLFGANASGKSNFVKALGFMKFVTISGLDRENCDRMWFRLVTPEKRNAEGVFQLTFFANGHFYEYGIAVSYDTASIVSEWLLLRDDAEKTIFSCDWKAKQITSDFTLPEGEDKKRFEVYCDDAKGVKLRKKSFLAEIAEKGALRNKGDFFTHFANAFDWFLRLIVIFPETAYGGMATFLLDEKKRHQFGNLLRHFDTGIEGLETVEVDAEKVLSSLSEQELATRKAQWIAVLTRAPSKVFHTTIGDTAYLVRYKEGALRMARVVANHGQEGVFFDREDESDGTKRLYDLLPLYSYFASGTVIVIDELDRNLHTQATREFIKLFFESSEGKRSQLIATTHDASVLDLDLLRQDEIWFVERDKDHASNLYSLSQFKARFDKDIQKDYLLGRYGAIPIFQAFDLNATEE